MPPLSDRTIRALKPERKARKVTDEKGLYLVVSPNGGKYWRLKYRRQGREKTLSIGTYPDVSLAAARRARDEARSLIAAGGDPSAQKQAAKRAGEDTLKSVARRWLAKETPGWAPAHARKVEQRFTRDVFPILGGRPVAEITPPEILAVVRRIADRGAVDTAHRALWGIGQVMRFAKAEGLVLGDPTAGLSEALPSPKGSHFAAVTDPVDLGALLRAVWGYEGAPSVSAALKLTPLLAVRPGELRSMEWVEIDFDAPGGPLWSIPAAKMKSREPHLVPLAKQAEEILRGLYQPFGPSPYVFPGARDPKRPMSEMTVTAALRRMGFESGTVTAHGFRATFRTLVDEVLSEPPHLIEHQLAHQVRDPLGRSYNRTTHLDERRRLMQRWADYLDTLRTTEAEKVVALRAGAAAGR